MKRIAFSPHDDLYVNIMRTSEKNNMSAQHYHDAYEIYFQFVGKRYSFYENVCYTLERGDVTIFKPFDLHYTESRESDYYERCLLYFHLDDLALLLSREELRIFAEKIDPTIIRLSEDQTLALHDHFIRTEAYSLERGFLAKKLFHSSALQLIMYIIKCTENKSAVPVGTVSPEILAALKYINAHYKERITLDKLSDEIHISKYHFCRVFKEITGAMVLEYLNNIRLAKVHSMLIHTDSNTDEIARETGFVSAVNLTRAFKKSYGVSPKSFRKGSGNSG